MIEIKLEEINNIRDLGGTLTQDGRSVRPRKLIRSGRLSEATSSDAAEVLGRWRVRNIVDLRSSKESAERPDPQWGIVDMFRMPLLTEEQLGFRLKEENGAMVRMSVFASLMEIAGRADFSPAEYLLTSYRQMVSGEQAKSSIKRFFDLMLTTDDAILYHCNGGKDRTGVLTALILTALNVSWETIKRDYIATNDAMEDVLKEKLANIPDEYNNVTGRGVMRMLYMADENYLEAARDEMCRLAGSPMGYLNNVIGLSGADIKELRDRYLAF